ncbi:5424_t:CDS:2, partial [Ambispora gerdemannii]
MSKEIEIIEEITIANCPQLRNLDCSGNQAEELAKFDGSKLEYNVVSYIGSLDDELYQQLKSGLPGSKHEDLQRLCFGCLANGGHSNNSSYHYHAKLNLTKGGTIEYGVSATGNKRETCEVPIGGGLLILDINSVDGGTIRIKRKEVENIKKTFVEIPAENQYSLNEKENQDEEITELKTRIQSLEKQVGEVGRNLSQTELEEGKADLEAKLLVIKKQLEESEKKRQELRSEANDFQNKLSELQKEKDSELEKGKKHQKIIMSKFSTKTLNNSEET